MICHACRNAPRFRCILLQVPDRVFPTLSPGFDWRADSLDWPVTTDVGPGLAGVIATGTRVMWLDPSSGRLAYRGVPVASLAAAPDFERVAFLLITGMASDEDSRSWERFRHNLRSSRRLPPDVVALVRDLDPTTHPTRSLRAGISALGCHELSVDDDISGDRHWRELRIVGQVAALVGEIVRHRRGAAAAGGGESDGSLAEELLCAISGCTPGREDIRTLDLLWVLYAAHGLDAPTFTSMVVASCLADPYTNVVAGLSALRGWRQGGAGEAVLDQLLDRSDPVEAEEWVRDKLASGGSIAGFGHPDYRMPDPRVVILRQTAASLASRKGRGELFEIARTIERAATRELAPSGVHINVNFYGALLFHLLGADPPLAPCLIAIARMAGLVALVREGLDDIRLYRPLSRYVGAAPRSIDRGGQP
jgi:citrate synthase